MKQLVVLLFLSFSTIVVNAHPFHVGVVEVSYNQKLNRFECAVKLFTDDTERTLRSVYNKEVLDITGSNEDAEVDSLLTDYLANNVEIIVKETPLQMYFIGKEGNADAIWSYIYFEAPSQFSSFSITASMLFELFEDQKNIIHWSSDDIKTFFMTDGDAPIQLTR